MVIIAKTRAFMFITLQFKNQYILIGEQPHHKITKYRFLFRNTILIAA